MNYKVILFGMLSILFSCSKSEDTISNLVMKQGQPNATTTIVPTSSKKGVGLNETNFGVSQLDALGVNWYYSWGPTTSVVTTKQFVPMCFSLNTLSRLTTYSTLLGFNEPDNSSQSNITVASAISNWGTLVTKSTRIGSPATAGNPLTTGSWLTQFMTNSPLPKVDFVCVHWYKGPNSSKFIQDMTAIIAKYGKPIWITEFAPQTTSSSTASPTKYTQAQVTAFINTVIPWMDRNPMIERYAWHDSKSGTSALFTTTGALTATGIAYRDSR